MYDVQAQAISGTCGNSLKTKTIDDVLICVAGKVENVHTLASVIRSKLLGDVPKVATCEGKEPCVMTSLENIDALTGEVIGILTYINDRL